MDDEPTEIPGMPDDAEAPLAEEPAPLDPFNGIPNIEAITERACKRVEDCLHDRGQQGGYEIASSGSWLAKRQLARTTYAGNLAHRKLLGGVFGSAGGNLSLRTMARIIALRAAKQAADLVGAEPFMQAMPAKIKDTQQAGLAKQGEAKIQEEIAASNMRMVLAESIRVALTEGERAIKITWEKDTTSFPDSAVVAIGADGQPLRTPRGQYIYQKDDILAVVADTAGNSRPAQTDEEGRPVEQLTEGETIQLRLKKEPEFIFTGDPAYQQVDNLLQTLVHRDGLHCAGLFTEDFIYPPFVPSLDDPACDIMVHRYDAVLESVLQEYQNAGYEQRLEQLVAASAPDSVAGQALRSAGEVERSTKTQQTFSVHETYYRAWITPEDGSPPFQTWLFIVIDYRTKLPIYANYLGRMKMKRPPFFLLRGLESEPGRAYGVGIYEKFNDRDTMIDVWFNRASLKSSLTNSITCAHVDGLEEVANGQEVVFGTTKIYKIKAGSEYGVDNPPVFRVNLSEMSDKEFELLREMIASGEAEFGAVDPTANNSENERGQQVATAIRNIERTGNFLTEASEAVQAGDIIKGLEIAVDAIFENMDAEEMAWVPGEEKLATLNRDEIRLLERNVRLLVTKAKGSDTVEIATAAKNTILEYYSLPMARRKDVRDQFIEILTSLNVADADDKLSEPTPKELQAEAAAAGEQDPPSVSIALSDLDHLAPSERDQVLQKYFGIKGADPNELATVKQQQHALDMEAASLKLMKPPGEGAQTEAPQEAVA